ncbi:MAG: ATP synthase delta chain [uncultured Gemmatimonadetes bacterium]|uniref:ATP synthase subunit delta n=1 Tax=uncultured Gemmatimonadota bacterium TaxID=203437 RepID=A0A6J4K674_9BACT|nr:MAG: ATP synthase delta chain [uncultured Gemmatimonadota bacterium]
MRSELIARNYAETLLDLADRNGGPPAMDQFAAALDEVAGLVQGDPRVRQFLETPRVTAAEKKKALRAALAGRAPELFLRFVSVLVDKRRQTLLPEIAEAFRGLVDERMGRVRVQVAISHLPDEALQAEIGNALARRLGRTVIPTFTVDPELLGGMVVRVGDEILDGSVRSSAARLRRAMMGAQLPPSAAPAAV